SAVSAPPQTPLARVTARDPHARAYVGVPQSFEANTNAWVTWRARSLTGLAGAPPDHWRRAMAYDLVRRGAVLRAWGVTYLDLPARVPADTSSLRPVLVADSVAVYAFGGALGRVYAVPFVVAVPDEDAAARALALADFDPRIAAVTTAAEAAGEYPGAPGTTFRWRQDDADEIALDVEASARSFLVIADTNFPGWTATLDERPAAIVPTNLLVRGLVVPPGRHRIHMRYETSGMRAGRVVTQIAFGVWALLLLLVLVRAARRRGTPAL